MTEIVNNLNTSRDAFFIKNEDEDEDQCEILTSIEISSSPFEEELKDIVVKPGRQKATFFIFNENENPFKVIELKKTNSNES